MAGGSVVVVGNAPTALFRLLELIEEGAERPARYRSSRRVHRAAKSKVALADHPSALKHLVLMVAGAEARSRRRRSTRCPQRRMTGVSPTAGGLRRRGRPGVPDLVTLKAARLIAAADVVAYTVARRGRRGVARASAARTCAGVVEVAPTYPVTIEPTDHPAATRLRWPTSTTPAPPGSPPTSTPAATSSSSARRPVLLRLLHVPRRGPAPSTPPRSCPASPGSAPPPRRPDAARQRDDVLTALPGHSRPTSSPRPCHRRRRGRAEAGRTFAGVVTAAEAAGVADRRSTSRASSAVERVAPLCEIDAAGVPYMSLVLVPNPGRRPAGR